MSFNFEFGFDREYFGGQKVILGMSDYSPSTYVGEVDKCKDKK